MVDPTGNRSLTPQQVVDCDRAQLAKMLVGFMAYKPGLPMPDTADEWFEWGWNSSKCDHQRGADPELYAERREVARLQRMKG